MDKCNIEFKFQSSVQSFHPNTVHRCYIRNHLCVKFWVVILRAELSLKSGKSVTLLTCYDWWSLILICSMSGLWIVCTFSFVLRSVFREIVCSIALNIGILIRTCLCTFDIVMYYWSQVMNDPICRVVYLPPLVEFLCKLKECRQECRFYNHVKCFWALDRE